MKKILMFLVFCLSLGALAEPNNLVVRIGIIQHFGKNKNDILTIQASSPYEKLEVICPKAPNQLDFRESITQNTNSLQIKISNFPSPENLTASVRVIAGAYRTYETASYWANNLKSKFPSYEWQVIYPGPWQIWAQTEAPQQLMENLFRENFNSAWIQQKPKTNKVLSWIQQTPQEYFNFNRRRLIIKSPSNKPIKINTKIYNGFIEIIPDSFGTYSVVNEVSIEDYLRGVVPFEIGTDSPRVALETQAILARTYTLANLQRFLPEGYNLCATQDCQVYGGLGAANKNIDDAIKNTQGIVLRDRSGQVAQVFYYSTDGGYSANYDDIWQASRYDKVRSLIGTGTCANLPDKFDLSKEEEAHLFLTSTETKTWGCYDLVSPAFRWEKKIKLTELTDAMKKAKDKWKFAWPEFREVYDLKVQKRSNTGRILELMVLTDNGSFIIEKDEVRAALGGLKSSFFVIDKINDEKTGTVFSLKGGGFGHSVGLSQFGARNLAAQGFSYDRILKIYFPNYTLGRI